MNSYDKTSPNDRGRLFFAGATMMDFLRRLAIDEDGPTAVEYAVMLAMIVALCLGSVALLSNQTAASFDDSANQLNGVLGS